MNSKKEWFLPNYQEMDVVGPFKYSEIVNFLQCKKVGVDEFIWGNHLSERKWERIYNLDEFKDCLKPYPKCKIPKKRSSGLKQSVEEVSFSFSEDGEYNIENIYRRYPRTPLEAEVIIHNQKHYHRARSVDISERGLFVRVKDTEIFEKGEEIVITILNSPYADVFSVDAVIIKVNHEEENRGYGIYFLRINPKLRRKIAKYVIDALGDNTKKSESA